MKISPVKGMVWGALFCTIGQGMLSASAPDEPSNSIAYWIGGALLGAVLGFVVAKLANVRRL